jgi:hypothetical protein
MGSAQLDATGVQRFATYELVFQMQGAQGNYKDSPAS